MISAKFTVVDTIVECKLCSLACTQVPIVRKNNLLRRVSPSAFKPRMFDVVVHTRWRTIFGLQSLWRREASWVNPKKEILRHKLVNVDKRGSCVCDHVV